MKAIINFGNPRKNMSAVADAVLDVHSSIELKITGVELYQSRDLLLTSAAYGAGMTLDLLSELSISGQLQSGDEIVFVGSMGSLNEADITLGDVVLPNPVGCAYYGFDEQWHGQDAKLLVSIKTALAQHAVPYREYKHGSSFAVFDPHTDHQTYSSSLYAKDVIGVDCGEVFLGFHFAGVNGIRAAAVLYCSDSPKTHISDIGADEFTKRANNTDVLLNNIGARVLRREV
jgi:purine-nucleoside phosphorylase